MDQAWHLHLLDSRAYWEEFCSRVLGQPLHHSPAKGAAGERERLREWYRCTLARYGETFGRWKREIALISTSDWTGERGMAPRIW
ncbi:MAG: hypothetical protein RLZZ117_981 [Cyanobacteriota bacterium]|jgi:hypothetical protein